MSDDSKELSPEEFHRYKKELRAKAKPFNLMKEAGVKDVKVDLKSIREKPTRPYRDGQDKALLVYSPESERDGMVLECSAFGPVEQEIESMSWHVDDLGFGTPPGPGLWIWEGSIEVYGGGFYDEYDVDVEYKGTFRRPTEDELSNLARGERLWLPLNRLLLQNIPVEQACHVLREWSLRPNTEQNREEWAQFERWLRTQYPEAS